MFDSLQEKLGGALRRVRGTGAISEHNITDAVREIRMALLAADVHLDVVRELIGHVKEQALGEAVLKSLTPEQQFVKIVHDELVKILGEPGKLPESAQPPTVWMLAGLQGSGKTTTAAKLARFYKKERSKRPFLIPADTHRPAAIDQLLTLAKQLDIPALQPEKGEKPESIVKRGLAEVQSIGCDLILVDTAGRLAIDEEMMAEAARLKAVCAPHAVIYVADAMSGQSALESAQTFHARLALSGLILTKADGDARGGAALSIRKVLGLPLYFLGTGEKPEALEIFHPDRLAGRLLGMGDVVSLVEKVQDKISLAEAEKAAESFQKGRFTLVEFRDALRQIKRLGPLDKLLGMLPGVPPGAMDALNSDPKQLVRVEAIIDSMTPRERERPDLLDGSRRKRISKGSGVPVSEINQLVNNFRQMEKMMKLMRGSGMVKAAKNPGAFKSKMRELMRKR